MNLKQLMSNAAMKKKHDIACYLKIVALHPAERGLLRGHWGWGTEGL